MTFNAFVVADRDVSYVCCDRGMSLPAFVVAGRDVVLVVTVRDISISVVADHDVTCFCDNGLYFYLALLRRAISLPGYDNVGYLDFVVTSNVSSVCDYRI